jgi:tRNA nucleotidyltransferase (CCA-adding enzyme)
VIDFFGGLRDLREGTIRVLHNLSFIEDPTRIFRAVRYENRYGFRMDEQTKSFAKSCVDMHLVGDLSSVRLREELVALLSEADVEWTLGRLFELGVARQVHRQLATDTTTAALVRRLDSLVHEMGLEDEVITWRLRLTAMTRDIAHDELYLWLEQLKIRRSDSSVIREGVVVAPLLPSLLSKDEMTDWEVFRSLRNYPVEALIFALGEIEEGLAYGRVRRYVSDLRHRTLSVTGDDLLAMGMKKSAAVGRLLERLRELRVNETIKGRQDELCAARNLLEKGA